MVTNAQEGSIKRTEPGNGWSEAGALSEGSFADPVGNSEQPVTGVSFRPQSDTHNLIVGLSFVYDPRPTYGTITHGIYLTAVQGVLTVESGQFRGPFAQYVANDTMSVRVNRTGWVEYVQNGQVLATSTKAARYPFYVDISLHTR